MASVGVMLTRHGMLFPSTKDALMAELASMQGFIICVVEYRSLLPYVRKAYKGQVAVFVVDVAEPIKPSRDGNASPLSRALSTLEKRAGTISGHTRGGEATQIVPSPAGHSLAPQACNRSHYVRDRC